MNNTDIAIISMSCFLPEHSDITSVWRGLLNPHPKKIPESELIDSNKTIIDRVLTSAISDISPKLEYNDSLRVGIFSQQPYQTEIVQVLKKLGIPSSLKNKVPNQSDNYGIRELYLFNAKQSLNDNELDLAIIADFSLAKPSKSVTGKITGGTVFILKRWQEAETCSNKCYALIKNIIPTKDNTSSSFENKKDQFQKRLEHSYAQSEIEIEKVGYLLLAEQLGQKVSIPDEIGHLFTKKQAMAATIAMAQLSIIDINSDTINCLNLSLLQASLALSSKLIPESNPDAEKINGIKAPVYFQHRTRPWFHGTDSSEPRLAAIHNSEHQIHLLMEEIPEFHPCARTPDLFIPWEAETIFISAQSNTQIIFQLEQLLSRIKEKETSFSALDLAAHLAKQIDLTCNYRLAIVYSDIDDLIKHVQNAIEQIPKGTKAKYHNEIYYKKIDHSETPQLACIFPGLGFPGIIGRYADNLLELCLRFPEVRQVFDLVELRNMNPEDPYPTSHLFFPPRDYEQEILGMLKQRLASPRYDDAQDMEIRERKNLSSFGVAVANWSSWRLIQSLGIPVDMLFGQSQGELSALCAGGKIDFKQFIKMHWETDIDPDYISDGGRLALISSNKKALQPIFKSYPNISIAVHIAPEFQIIGGDKEEIEAMVKELQKKSIWTQILPYPAIHTPHFTSLRTRMEPELKHIDIYPSTLPVYSGLTGNPYPENADETRKGMIDNLDHPVLLWQTTRNMYKDGANILLQAGGGATMYSQAKTNIGADDVIATSIDVDYRGPIEQLNHLCATLFTAGVNFESKTLYQNRKAVDQAWNINEYLSDIATDQHESKLLTTEKSYAPLQDKKTDIIKKQLDKNGTLPFTGDVLEYSQGKSLLVNYFLDIDEDLYLADHVFAYAWDVKPLNECLPVVPLTISLEVMAEVAANLAPNLGLIGFKEIVASNWIGLRESDTLQLKISAKLLTNEEDSKTTLVYVELTSENSTHPDTKGIVMFSNQYQLNIEINPTTFTNIYSYPLDAKEIYRTRKLFHGPLFQCITEETQIADQGVIGELTVLPKHKMFKNNTAPFLMTDPLLLDAVGQLIGLWAMERNLYVFPISLEHLEIYTITPPTGTRVPVTILLQRSTPHTLYVDVEIQDGNGNVWMRIKNWGDWTFKWPKVFADYRRFPKQYMMSAELDLEEYSESSCTRILDSALVSQDMEETLARITLHSDEMLNYLKQDKHPRRRQQWLMGRLVAKEAIRDWLRTNKETEIHPSSIFIDVEKQGRPIMRPISGLPTPHISLSHTDKFVVAIATDVQVGIDIEAIQERDDAFTTMFASTEETNLLQQLTYNSEEKITRLWSAKESFSKALGTGLPSDPKVIQLKDTSSQGDFFHLYHKPLKLNAKIQIWNINKHILTITNERMISDDEPSWQTEQNSLGVK